VCVCKTVVMMCWKGVCIYVYIYIYITHEYMYDMTCEYIHAPHTYEYMYDVTICTYHTHMDTCIMYISHSYVTICNTYNWIYVCYDIHIEYVTICNTYNTCIMLQLYVLHIVTYSMCMS